MSAAADPGDEEEVMPVPIYPDSVTVAAESPVTPVETEASQTTGAAADPGDNTRLIREAILHAGPKTPGTSNALAALDRLTAQHYENLLQAERDYLNETERLAGLLAAAEARCVRAEQALRFYADRDNYMPKPRRVRPIITDNGGRARAALAAVDEPAQTEAGGTA